MPARLEPAAPADVAAIMRLERLPGHERWVGRWDGEQHRREMRLAGAAYLVWREAGAVAGFVLFQQLDEPTARLRRMAVAQPGQGVGRALLAGALDWVFREHPVERLWLDLRDDNERARRAYAAAGFGDEGLVDDPHATPGGEVVRVRRMALTRSAWSCR